MAHKIFILIPSLSPYGPVKGAIALANELVNTREVTLVPVKYGSGANAHVDERIEVLNLAKISNTKFGKISAYRKILKQAGGRKKVASISMCFSADFINLFCKSRAVTCSSVRGNLINNYRMEYGLLGIFLAFIHFFCLRFFDVIVAMTKPMAEQVKFYSNKMPHIIGNFIDEKTITKYQVSPNNSDQVKFIFIGSLTERKKTDSLIRAASTLKLKGLDFHLDIVGDGPLHQNLKDLIIQLDLNDHIKLHGFIPNPFNLLANADVMVLPSLSEGMSRAVLEALFLGIPCVLRNVDGNKELISERINGMLFSHDDELPEAMIEIKQLRRNRPSTEPISLLPAANSQELSVKNYLDLVESIS